LLETHRVMSKFSFSVLVISCILFQIAKGQSFRLDSMGYFKNEGVNVMVFDDIYPEGHQGGIGIIMHGDRIAANGDLRLEATPGQWQPIPKQHQRIVHPELHQISVKLSYPDSSKHLHGFNPIVYPDVYISYQVTVKNHDDGIMVTVDLDHPLPEEYIGHIGFNIELYPADLFGKPWIMDKQSGIFSIQPNGPVNSHVQHNNTEAYHPIKANQIIASPYATGKKLIINPNNPLKKITIESLTKKLELLDGRINHNNGWFVVRSQVTEGATQGAVKWLITPNVVKDWKYTPVIQTSQLGYHPRQKKEAIIELDAKDTSIDQVRLIQISSTNSSKVIKEAIPALWGKFLRYNYLKFDFSEIKAPGLYRIEYRDQKSTVFNISNDIYKRGAWQPVLEYFLPVQMCHMRVNEKYRVWHGCCHMDDARMAPVNHNHFDGYVQGEFTLSDFLSGDHVPGLNVGGWHDAGDYDLRVESQSAEIYILALAQEAFKIDYDQTAVNQETRITEIHQPDGKQDILQQIEHGVLSVVGGYQSLGRLYRGIICNNLRQYVMLGDAANMTDNVMGSEDDRWVFTEENPYREMSTAAHLAAASRVLRAYNDTLSQQSLDIAVALYQATAGKKGIETAQIQAAAELFLTTNEHTYSDYILSQKDYIANHINEVAWFIGRADQAIGSRSLSKTLRPALIKYNEHLKIMGKETPYGIPYRPHIWGAGWGIQSMGFQHYFLTIAYPDIFDADIVYSALNFVLGCHPGKNASSFASGVGAKSATVAYGVNRGDWSFIPGGVISGTALIRPDFPELLDFPFLWQQTEYVMGGGSSHYMFLVLAAQQLLNNDEQQ